MQDLTSRRRLLPPSSPAILVPSGAIIVVYIVCRTTSRVPIDPLSRRHSPLNIDTLTLRDSISSPSSYLVACCTNNHFLGRTVSFDSKRFYSRHPKDMIPQKTTTVHASPTRHDQVRQKIMLYQNPPPLLLLNPPPPPPPPVARPAKVDKMQHTCLLPKPAVSRVSVILSTTMGLTPADHYSRGLRKTCLVRFTPPWSARPGGRSKSRDQAS